MKASLNLCLLFSLISPVVLLRCKRCVARSDHCSHRRSEICFKHAICKSYLFYSDVFLTTIEAGKSCVDSNWCDPGNYSLTTSGGGFLNMFVDCCTTDNCNSKRMEVSPESMEPNGLECEGCHVEDQETCEGVEMVKCLGDQTKCASMMILYTGMLDVSYPTDLFIKGCATPLMCDEEKVNKNMDNGSLGRYTITVKCTDAILSPNVSSLAWGASDESHS